MKKAALAAVVLALAFCACAFAKYAPEVLKVTGDVKVMKKDAAGWTAAAEKMSVSDGDRFRTAADGSVVIGFVLGRKNIAIIGPDTEAVVASGREPTYTIDLQKGEATLLILNLPESSTFEVTTPAGVGGAKGTGWRVLTDGDVSTFEAYDNTIYVKGLYADGSVTEDTTFVDMGYKTTVRKLQIPGPVEKLAPADMDRWNAWRDEVMDLQAKAAEVHN